VGSAPQEIVRFLVADVIHPRPTQVLMELFRHLDLEGEVVGETTDGRTPFLVVRVPRLSEAVIVPLDKVRRAGTPVPPATGG
jgi:hypothetical protein